MNINNFDLICRGDVNINMLANDSTKMRLDVLLNSRGLFNVINLPTRVTQNLASLIDIFFTNISSDRTKSGVLLII